MSNAKGTIETGETEEIIQLQILPLTPGTEASPTDLLDIEQHIHDETTTIIITHDNDLSAQASDAAEPKPGPSQPQASEDIKVDLRTDLKNIMHAFGDSDEPMEASIDLIELILQLELGGFLFLCEYFAISLTGSKVLGLKEAILTLRKEKSRLLRLFKHLVSKDQQMRFTRLNQMNVKSGPSDSFVAEIRSVLELIDTTGEMLQLLTTESSDELAKTDKATRADRQYTRVAYPQYIAHAKARSVSFARKLTSFPEWIQRQFTSEFGLSHSFVEVLTFLAYDLVAYMVDLAFLVRREKQSHSNPVLRLQDSRGANPDTCTSILTSPVKKRKDDDFNHVSEILIQASEMEAKRIKKVAKSAGESSVLQTVCCLTPDEIYEAYYRLQTSSSLIPSCSYKSRAERCMQLHTH